MRSIVLGLLLPCLSLPALAQAVYRTDEVTVWFFTTPCEVPPLVALLKNDGVVRKARVVYQGRRIEACYITNDAGDHLLIDVEGDGAVIPHKQVNPGA